MMAVHIFNISVDMPDVQPDYVPEDLSINDQETFVELILEEVLGIDNAIAEYDDHDEHSTTLHSSKDVKLYAAPVQIIPNLLVAEIPNVPVSHTTSLYFQYIKEIIPPPPKA